MLCLLFTEAAESSTAPDLTAMGERRCRYKLVITIQGAQVCTSQEYVVTNNLHFLWAAFQFLKTLFANDE